MPEKPESGSENFKLEFERKKVQEVIDMVENKFIAKLQELIIRLQELAENDEGARDQLLDQYNNWRLQAINDFSGIIPHLREDMQGRKKLIFLRDLIDQEPLNNLPKVPKQNVEKAFTDLIRSWDEVKQEGTDHE
ncbi:MAG: hypothetical protein Q8P83_02225 [bacterium]|nr:hypothetical protein [bacterium]